MTTKDPDKIAAQNAQRAEAKRATRAADRHAGPIARIDLPTDGPGEWAEQGYCRNTPDPDDFFPLKSRHANWAKWMCSRCPVAAECLDYALTNPEWGVWGGTTEEERRGILRRGLQATAVAAARARAAELAASAA